MTDEPLPDLVVPLRCVVGSRAYGLETDASDVDRRGCYLPPADLHWSLHGVPEQFESPATEECYWEIQKFIDLALRANPNEGACHERRRRPSPARHRGRPAVPTALRHRGRRASLRLPVPRFGL